MIKNILLDFAETIAELKPTREDILEDFLVQKKIKISKQKIYQVYKYIDISLPYSSVKINNIVDKNNFYLKYNHQLFTMLGLVHFSEDINKEFLDFFLGIKKHWTIKTDLFELLKELKKDGYSLSLISNFDTRLKDILHNLKLDDFFDFVHISQEAGLEKPDINFYKSFFEISKYNMSETIYIGDSYLLDYAPAKKIGLNVYLLDESHLYSHINERIISILDVEKSIQGKDNVKV
jgi:HAD superfamily hydrolase (TIGR01549 family)